MQPSNARKSGDERTMTAKEFRQWLAEHYGRGQRLAFVTDYNAMAEGLGDVPITMDALENWLYRQPPQGRRFEQTLDLVLTWRQSAKPTINVYTINYPVTAEQQQMLKEVAGDGENAIPLFLRSCLEWAVQDEIKVHLASIEEKRKAKKSGGKVTVIRPPLEYLSNLESEPAPKRKRK